MSAATKGWRTLPAGRELDELVADAMEPRATLPVITAHEARLQHWGADPSAWTWYSVSYVSSPDGWWQAEIGTDHGAPGSDHQPVRWFVSHERQPSTDIAAAWLVLDAMDQRGLSVTVRRERAGGPWSCSLWDPNAYMHAADEIHVGPAPLAICRAALTVAEAAS